MEPRYCYDFAEFRFDPDKQTLLRNGEPVVPFQPKTSEVLQILIENRDRVVTKDEIMTKVWRGISVEIGSLNFQINLLRKALDDDFVNPKYIRTVRGSGFQFIASVKVVQIGGANSPEPATGKEISKPRFWLLFTVSAAVLLFIVLVILSWVMEKASLGIDSITMLDTPTLTSDSKLKLNIQISGHGFDQSKVQVVVVGPGCPRIGNCVVPNNVLDGVSDTQIERVPLLVVPGDYEIYVRNGEDGEPSKPTFFSLQPSRPILFSSPRESKSARLLIVSRRIPASRALTTSSGSNLSV